MTDECIEYAKICKQDGDTYSEVILQLKDVYNEIVSIDQLRRALNPRARTIAEVKSSQSQKQEIVGIIGDTHFPFSHPNYLNFIQDTFKKHGVTKIIHIGDICDNHA